MKNSSNQSNNQTNKIVCNDHYVKSSNQASDSTLLWTVGTIAFNSAINQTTRGVNPATLFCSKISPFRGLNADIMGHPRNVVHVVLHEREVVSLNAYIYRFVSWSRWRWLGEKKSNKITQGGKKRCISRVSSLAVDPKLHLLNLPDCICCFG